jgi:hypothetical protein
MTDMSESTTISEERPTDTKPPKKTKWYWNLLFALGGIWYCGGVDVFLLRDIPLLLFLIPAVGLFMLPVIWIDRQPKRKLIPFLIGSIWMIATLAVIFVVVAFVLPPFYISPQTSYLTEPRAKEYYGIDYVAVIEKQLPTVPPEDNGFRPLVEALGLPPFGDGYAVHWTHICQYLDLPPDIEPKLTYTDWWAYHKSLSEEEKGVIKSFTTHDTLLPCSEEEMPIVRRWLDDNEAALDLFVVASQKPGMYIPPVFDHTLLDAKLINEQTFRNMARGLQIRVRYQLALGEVDKAWDDVLAMYRIGEHQRLAVHCTVNSLVHIALVRMANHTAESVVIHSDWDSDKIRRRAANIMPFQRPYSEDELKNILRNERLVALDAMQYIANNGDFDILSPSGTSDCCPSGAFDSGFDEWYKRKALRFNRWGLVMNEINKKFDDMEERLFSGAPEPGGKGRFGGEFHMYEFLKLFAGYGKNGAVAIAIGEMMGELLVPAIDAYLGAVKRHEAEGSLLPLVFTLESYHRDNGSYPERLDDLLGRYMDEIPLDPFSGEPLRYILEEGGYLLYSIGPNGIDEEGRGYSDAPKGDDIRRINSLVRNKMVNLVAE